MTDRDDVTAFIDRVPSDIRREDARIMIDLIERITGIAPGLWGPTIVGFGQYHYRYASGREGDAPAAGFSPRKAATTIYLPDGVGAHADALGRLGPHSTGVGCLYIKRLSEVDLAVLEGIITASWKTVTDGTFGHRAAESSKNSGDENT
ncbi:uncharacterized protein DUF1801 [Homoserinimonas aerilata]|uniref:Uncharacterized protein DUF1801 n=1 Tax=Homoserinimonas aerilata TaxID=1162970 RepID=A0A542YJC5_9MICO|nr:DUF1801 domain-containing protein [Homoserinimonas aerilata]TQL48196.1 uncharacterized protein DUF1801 [Homoserinimonas aerilata]